MEQILVRQIKMADANSMQLNIFPANNISGIKKSIRKSIKLFNTGTGYRFVALIENSVVGNVELIFDTHPLLCHRGEIFSLIVSEDWRRIGIGKHLVEKCIETAQKVGLRCITLSVRSGTAAEKFYLDMGFIKYGELPNGLMQIWDGQSFGQSLYFMEV